MVKILYDFDVNKINNCKFYDRGSISMLTKEYTSNLLKKSESMYNYQFLGGGIDSVCFIENKDNLFYIAEPANGIFVSFQMIEGLVKFEKVRKEKIIDIFTFGTLMDETIFRPHRNDDEISILGRIKNFIDINKNIIILKYPNSTFEWKCKYIDFVPELLRFGERMMHLYDRLLPDFKEYALYPKLKAMLLDDNILRQNYGHLMEFDNLGKSFLDYISPPFDEM
jgi:hypothetical protein